MKSKTKKLLAIGLSLALAAGCTMVLSACDPEEEPPVLTDEPLAGETVADFTQGESERFFSSDGWTNKSVFNTWWSADNVSYEGGVMQLTIDENPDGSEATYDEYFGGEARSHEWYGYGDFEVRMKPAKKAGTASTFFTCTGDYDTNLEGEKNPWDEIDIEFLGKDTTQVQFNYYVNGQGGHEYMYDLGFDASEEFHNYGFRWTEDYICWFVDGEPVHKVEASEGNPMPAAAGRILMNYWCGTSEAEGWMGAYSDPGDEGPVYEWVKTSGDVYMSDIKEEEGGKVPEVPEGTEAQKLLFNGDSYESDAAEAAETVTLTYENIGGSAYAPASADIAAVAGEHNTFTAKIKNNGTEAVQARFDILGANQNAGLQTAAVNLSAVKADGTQLRTDLQYGGSFIDLAAGEEAVVFITYNNADAVRGAVTTLNVFLDSARGDENTYSGSVTLSEMMFFTNEGAVQPGVPGGSDSSVQINGADIPVQGNDYTVAVDENNAMHVTYTGIQGATYKNVNITDISAVAKDNNTFTAKVTNNGSETLTLRIDVMANEQVTPNTKACNISATMDGQAVYTDRDWGGSTFEIAAGKTVTVKVVYDASYGPQSLQMMFDSSIYEDTAVHSGDVTVAEMAFSKASAPAPDPVPDPVPEQPGEGETEPDPVPEPVPGGSDSSVQINGADIPVQGNDYTVTVGEDNAMHVTYTGIQGTTYKNVNITDISAVAKDSNTFTAKVTNNGRETLTLRIDVVANEQVTPNTKVCNVSATMDGQEVYTDRDWGGSTFKIAAGKTVTVKVVYDASYGPQSLQMMFDSSEGTAVHSGDVTVAEMAFSKASAPAPEPEPEPEPVRVPIGTQATIGGDVGEGDVYTVSVTEEGALNVAYTDLEGGNYENVNLAVAEIAGESTVFSLKVTNNGSEKVTLRINMQSATHVTENTTACNLSATMDGQEVDTDLVWGGSKFEIEASKTVSIEVTFDATKDLQSIEFMIDSCIDRDTATHSGDVTFSEMKLLAEKAEQPGEGETEPEPDTKPAPGVPEGTEAQKLLFNGDSYESDAAEAAETVTLTYENIGGSAYAPASADIAAVAGEHNTFTAKIKNNGTEAVQARFDILGANQNAGLQTAAVNLSAVKADGTQLRTDLQYGGSFIDLAAGEEAVVFITYNNADAVRGAVTTLNVFLDSARGDENTYSGSVTLSEMMFFTNEGAVQPGEEETEQPEADAGAAA